MFVTVLRVGWDSAVSFRRVMVEKNTRKVCVVVTATVKMTVNAHASPDGEVTGAVCDAALMPAVL